MAVVFENMLSLQDEWLTSGSSRRTFSAEIFRVRSESKYSSSCLTKKQNHLRGGTSARRKHASIGFCFKLHCYRAAFDTKVARKQKKSAELLWQEFFSDPSQWWDHRFDKNNARYPDFKHKKTEDALWIDGRSVPSWAKAELAAMKPGTVTRIPFSWNEKIRKYVNSKQDMAALEIFKEMQREGVHPDRFTFLSVLSACANLASMDTGKRVHEELVKCGYEEDLYVSNSLINMYVKCGCLGDAYRVFDTMSTRDVVSWSVMIMGYAKGGQGQKALEFFEQMQQEGIKANFVTHLAVLNACANLGALDYGRSIHAKVLRSSYETDFYMESCLVNMYCKCGSLIDARKVFDNMPRRNVVTWNSIIAGYLKCGQGDMALDLYQEMQLEHVKPDRITYVGIMNACAELGALGEGRCLHAQVIHSGCDLDNFLESALIDMYGKCGSIEDACRVFNAMVSRDVVSWSAMIVAYNKCGQGKKALELFQLMQLEQVDPSPVTYLAILNACANVVALEEGRHVHAEIIQKGYQTKISLMNTLIDMYAKCGSIHDSCKVFENMPARNVVSWTTMIGGYAMHGLGKEALDVFEHMCQEVAEIDSTSFICLLSACSHAGLLDEGHQFFEFMSPAYGISPEMCHYTCMVDLLGRLGHLDEAEDFIRRMSLQPEISIWMALLGACRIHGDERTGEHAAKQVLALDPDNVSGYWLLSNIYVSPGNWTCEQRLSNFELNQLDIYSKHFRTKFDGEQKILRDIIQT